MSRDRFENALQESPLAVGVAALAAGLLAGFALPRTRVEDRTIGRGADDFRDEAMRRGREVVEQGKEVASHLADEALGDAEKQGLTPDTLGSKVARVAKDAMHAAKDSARREGIDTHSLAEKARHVGETVKEKGKAEVKQATGQSKVETDTNTKPGPLVTSAASGSSCSTGLPTTGGSMGSTKVPGSTSNDPSDDRDMTI